MNQYISSQRTIYKANGPAVRKAREEARLGLREAAWLLDISPAYLSRLETCSDVSVSESLLVNLSELFKRRSDLLSGNP